MVWTEIETEIHVLNMNVQLFKFCSHSRHFNALVSVRTFGVMYDHTFYKQVQISRSDIRPHMKWVVSLTIAYGHFNLPPGIVWV